eukprot:403341562
MKKTRELQRTYVNLQKSLYKTFREFYEEGIYYLHQPQSVGIKYLVCVGLGYVCYQLMHDYQVYYTNTFKRKEIRLHQMLQTDQPMMSREGQEIINKFAIQEFPL